MDPRPRRHSLTASVALAAGWLLGAASLTAQVCGKPIACGQTITGRLGNGSCIDSGNGGGFYDAYTFNGIDHEEVTATISTAEGIELVGLVANGDFSNLNGSLPVAFSATLANSANFSTSLNQTSSNWFFAVTSVDSSFNVIGQPVDYTLSVACSGLTSCRADAQTLCLDSGRFKVQATFATSQGQSGQAQVVSLSDDTGYLWFFGPTNVEAVVKVLNGCGLGGHYWVFAGGLTNVRVVLTVTDTKTNKVKTYTNHQNTTFQPIQDTSAFATCP